MRSRLLDGVSALLILFGVVSLVGVVETFLVPLEETIYDNELEREGSRLWAFVNIWWIAVGVLLLRRVAWARVVAIVAIFLRFGAIALFIATAPEAGSTMVLINNAPFVIFLIILFLPRVRREFEVSGELEQTPSND